MTVINTCDYNQTKAATLAIADHHGPVYLRFGRPVVPNFHARERPTFRNRESRLLLNEGSDVTIVATGHLVWEALVGSRSFGSQRRFCRSHQHPYNQTIGRRSDSGKSLAKTKCIVTAEEHNILGGLGRERFEGIDI